MRFPVVLDCFLQSSANVIAILVPNVVCISASYNDCMPKERTQPIPLDKDYGALVLHFFNLGSIGINHAFLAYQPFINTQCKPPLPP
jgi:hypothetical protein